MKKAFYSFAMVVSIVTLCLNMILGVRLVTALWRCWRGARGPVRPETVRRFWRPSGVPGSAWRLGWDGPAVDGYSAAGSALDRGAVGHLGFTGSSLWIEPERGFWIVLLTNRVHPRVDNVSIRALRPALHDLIVAELRP